MMRSTRLTQKQRKVLGFIRERIQEDIPPTIREIAQELGFTSTGTVRDYLYALEKKGYLKRSQNKSRAIELLKDESWGIPLIASINAGEPNLAYEDLQGYINLEDSSLKKKDIFALRVRGDSMVEAGILEGDIALIRKQPHADNGEIIAALLENNEVTLKRLRCKGNTFFLEAANSNYRPIHRNFTIIGRLVSILRKYEQHSF